MTIASFLQGPRVTLPERTRAYVYVAWRCDRVHARAIRAGADGRGSPLNALAGTDEPVDYGTAGPAEYRLALLILAHYLDEEDITLEDLEHRSRLQMCPACVLDPNCPECGGLGFQLVPLRCAVLAPAFAAEFLERAAPTLPLLIRSEQIARWLREQVAGSSFPATSTPREPIAHRHWPARPQGDQ